MKLLRVHVTNYKCVLDSEEFTVGDMTCFVGKNESGKTALLEALEKVNSVRSERADLKSTDYPRVLGPDIDQDHERVIAAVFELDEDETAKIVELAGTEDALTSRTIEVTKGHTNKLKCEIPLSYAACVKAIVEGSGLSDAEKAEVEQYRTTTDLFDFLNGLEEHSPRQSAFIDELNTRFPRGSLRAEAENYLMNRLPKFVYYSVYDSLHGRMSVDQIRTAIANQTVENVSGGPVFLSLLSMVGIKLEDLSNNQTWESVIARLESVGSGVSRHIFKYWSQNKHLKVRFYVHEGHTADPPPFNTGAVFETRIENTRHDASIRLDERSTGFIWFFSFLVWFSEIQKTHGDNLIVLLDEPGLSLHAKAQQDLLRYMREELLPKYQLLYTTHSPFMVDSHDVSTARTVEDATSSDEEVLGTKVGDQVLSADGDTLFPLRAALSYDISQTLFVGEHTLLVEGPSDLLFIQWASTELRKAKRTALDPRWTITPCGGIAKIQSFLALFGGNKLHVAVLTDLSQGDKRKARDLRESELLRQGHVFTANDYGEANGALEGDTEDIVGRRFYVDLVNATYGLAGAQKLRAKKPKDAPVRVTLEVADHFRLLPPPVDQYDHYFPAAYLVAHADVMASPARDEAIDRFEKLFVDINRLL